MKLYLVRHGQTIWNSQRKMQGWGNSNLTDKGILEAKKLGERLSEIDFKQVYSSPAGRAIETAEHASGLDKSKIEIVEGFKEMGFGSWEGREIESFQGEDKIQFEKLWNDPANYEAIGGESYEEVGERVKSAFEELLLKHRDEEILMVSHGVLIRVFLSILKETQLKDIWEEGVTPNTSLTVIEFLDNGDYNMLLEGDISHLN